MSETTATLPQLKWFLAYIFQFILQPLVCCCWRHNSQRSHNGPRTGTRKCMTSFMQNMITMYTGIFK